jgi:hypothetical protein
MSQELMRYGKGRVLYMPLMGDPTDATFVEACQRTRVETGRDGLVNPYGERNSAL